MVSVKPPRIAVFAVSGHAKALIPIVAIPDCRGAHGSFVSARDSKGGGSSPQSPPSQLCMSVVLSNLSCWPGMEPSQQQKASVLHSPRLCRVRH